jgi:hypothetical protein
MTGFAVALFGQTLASLTQPIVMSVGTKIAAEVDRLVWQELSVSTLKISKVSLDVMGS